MRILFVAAHIGKGGGQAVQAARIISEIRKKGHSCLLLALSTKEKLVQEPCKTIYAGRLSFPRGVLQLRSEILKQRFDVVQCFDPFFSLPAAYLAGAQPRVLRIGMNPVKEFSQRRMPIHEVIFSTLFPTLLKDTKVVVNSEALADDYLEHDPWIIRNGFSITKTMKKHSQAEKIRLLYSGKVIPRKNLEVVFEAIRGLPVSFIILGNINEEHYGNHYYEHLRKRYKGGDFTFLGEKPSSEVESELLEADAFVNPSLLEGSPNSVIEAMIAGLPVLCSDIPEHREIMSPERGIFFKDAEGLRQGIRKLADPHLRERMGSAGRRYAEEHHDIARKADEYLMLYESIRNEGGGR